MAVLAGRRVQIKELTSPRNRVARKTSSTIGAACDRHIVCVRNFSRVGPFDASNGLELRRAPKIICQKPEERERVESGPISQSAAYFSDPLIPIHSAMELLSRQDAGRRKTGDPDVLREETQGTSLGRMLRDELNILFVLCILYLKKIIYLFSHHSDLFSESHICSSFASWALQYFQLFLRVLHFGQRTLCASSGI